MPGIPSTPIPSAGSDRYQKFRKQFSENHSYATKGAVAGAISMTATYPIRNFQSVTQSSKDMTLSKSFAKTFPLNQGP